MLSAGWLSLSSPDVAVLQFYRLTETGLKKKRFTCVLFVQVFDCGQSLLKRSFYIKLLFLGSLTFRRSELRRQ